MPPSKPAQMVFDTNCVLCSGVVHFVLEREVKSVRNSPRNG